MKSLLARTGLHQEARAEQFADQRFEHQIDGEILLQIIGAAHDGLDRFAGALPDVIFQPGLLAGLVIPARRCPCRSRPDTA